MTFISATWFLFQQHSCRFSNIFLISATFFSLQQHSFDFSNILCISATANFSNILSKVDVPGFNEEYLLLTGGQINGYPTYDYSDKVQKFNGRWSFFGNLQKTRYKHNSVFLNGRVLIIGGGSWMKTETWDSSKSRFETESIWPELHYWSTTSNLVFIIPDYINP